MYNPKEGRRNHTKISMKSSFSLHYDQSFIEVASLFTLLVRREGVSWVRERISWKFEDFLSCIQYLCIIHRKLMSAFHLHKKVDRIRAKVGYLCWCRLARDFYLTWVIKDLIPCTGSNWWQRVRCILEVQKPSSILSSLSEWIVR